MLHAWKWRPRAIWTRFDALKDPQVERTPPHWLMDIVMISVTAVIGYADGWTDLHESCKTLASGKL